MTNTAPFWVAGLQQFWKNDSLILYICAVPPEETRSPRTKFRVRITDPILNLFLGSYSFGLNFYQAFYLFSFQWKNMKRGWTSFYQRVSKFLAQTHLTTVTSWLPELNHLLEQQAHPALISLPSSRLDCFVSVSPDKEVKLI